MGSDRGGATQAADRRRLRAVQAMVLALIAALAWAGRGESYWPIVTWPVYDDARPRPVGPTLVRLEARGVTASGLPVAFGKKDLVERGRQRVADRAFAGWNGRPEQRRYLVGLLERAAGEPLAQLEMWQLEWPVDAMAVPPVDRAVPPSERRLGDMTPDLKSRR